VLLHLLAHASVFVPVQAAAAGTHLQARGVRVSSIVFKV
jgi:hypothetical protein